MPSPLVVPDPSSSLLNVLVGLGFVFELCSDEEVAAGVQPQRLNACFPFEKGDRCALVRTSDLPEAFVLYCDQWFQSALSDIVKYISKPKHSIADLLYVAGKYIN